MKFVSLEVRRIYNCYNGTNYCSTLDFFFFLPGKEPLYMTFPYFDHICVRIGGLGVRGGNVFLHVHFRTITIIKEDGKYGDPFLNVPFFSSPCVCDIL